MAQHDYFTYLQEGILETRLPIQSKYAKSSSSVFRDKTRGYLVSQGTGDVQDTFAVVVLMEYRGQSQGL